VTFGCFNAAYKLSPSALSLWSEVLHAVPSSRLLLNAPEYRYADTRARICAVFAEHEIGPERLEFHLGAAEPIAMLAAYGEVDIALDPMPYSGGLTTIEGLYMGVPAITLPGTRFGSRHSSVHLRAIGLTDWIAPDRGGYVQLARDHAADPAKLAALRSGLRSRVEQSPLVDGAGFAREFCQIVRDLWRRACQRQADQARARERL
jgi:predicted O-linked N-acetylglucosamine transferase (SPINDLY family)